MEEIFVASLQENVKSILKFASDEKVQEVIKVLVEDVGLECMDDTTLVKDEDLEPVLKPVQRRKLLLAWQDKASNDFKRSTTLTDDEGNIQSNINQSCLMLQPTFAQSCENVNISSNWLQNFCIPWQKMPADLLKSLKCGERIHPRSRKEMIRIIADEIRNVTVLPGIKAIRFIAKKMTEKYPGSLMDRHNGEIFADGASSLVKQLRNRLENLNRGTGSSQQKISLEDVENQQGFKRKETKKYGCMNWKAMLPEGENEHTQETKRVEMLQHIELGPRNLDESIIRRLITETFSSQRVDINGCMELHDMLQKWPALFSKPGMLTHFQLLVEIDLEQKLSESIKTKGERLLEFLKTLPPGSNRKKLEVALTTGQDSEKCAEILCALIDYFGEKADIIFKDVALETSSSDLQRVVNMPTTPCLLACGDNFFDSNHYILIIDGIVVNEDIKNFQEGFLMVFGAFFVFNIKYPENIDNSLEFLQRCFFSINPDRGSKSSRKCLKDPVLPRVQTLINNLSDFEWL